MHTGTTMKTEATDVQRSREGVKAVLGGRKGKTETLSPVSISKRNTQQQSQCRPGMKPGGSTVLRGAANTSATAAQGCAQELCTEPEEHCTQHCS